MKTKLTRTFFGLVALLGLLVCSGGACSFAEGAERQAGDRMVLTINDIEYAFRWCPPGTFTMGSPPDERRREEDETQHQVTLTRGFWMLETSVTNTMWRSLMGGRSPSRGQGALGPVEQVTWYDSQEFIKKLNELNVAPAGFKFSLPTEAQWEYACRAGTTTVYNFGDVFNRRDQAPIGISATVDVGAFPANAWGLHDMHGNVNDWCLDWYGEYPSGAVTDPTGPATGTSRVVRGGSWHCVPGVSRSASRCRAIPTFTYNGVGLRLVLVSVEGN